MMLCPNERKILIGLKRTLQANRTVKAPATVNAAAASLMERGFIAIQGGQVVVTARGNKAAMQEMRRSV